MNENENKNPEIDYSEIKTFDGGIHITPIGNPEGICLEKELEQRLNAIRNIPFKNEEQYRLDIGKANDMLYIFNIGLLCGLKTAKMSKKQATINQTRLEDKYGHKGQGTLFFEQSGTFKNEFIKLGIPAEDYDIQDNFGQTDHIVDLFAEIESAYGGGR